MEITTGNQTAAELNDKMANLLLPFNIFMGLVVALGIPGNSLVLFVYGYRYPKCNFKYFVLCCATIDLTSCLLVIPGEIYTQIRWFVYENSIVCSIKSYLNTAAVYASVWTFFLIAVHRYRKVCKPLSWQIPVRIAKRCAFGVIVLPLLFASPVIFLWGRHTEVAKLNNNTNITTTLSTCEKADKYKDTKWPSVFIQYCYMLPNAILTAVTFILYVLIAAKLLSLRRSVPTASVINSNEAGSRRVKKTLMMFILTLIFVVTITIYYVHISKLSGSNQVFERMSNNNLAQFLIFLRIYYINCVINPVLYGIFDFKFREMLKRFGVSFMNSIRGKQ